MDNCKLTLPLYGLRHFDTTLSNILSCDSSSNSHKIGAQERYISVSHIPHSDVSALTHNSFSMPRRRQGPLATFFNQYTGFRYDPTESATDEFRRLCRQQMWDRYDPAREEAREEYRTAVVSQFNVNYGTDVDALESWHTLCKYIGIDPIPDTLEACKRVRIICIFRNCAHEN